MTMVPPQLTPRELDVLRLLCAGVTSYADVCAALVISPTTLNYHVAQLRMKLGCDDRVQIVAYALVHGLLEGSNLEWRGGRTA